MTLENTTARAAATTRDRLFHTYRDGDGRWQPLVDLGAAGEGGPAGFVGATCTCVGGALAIVGVGTDGKPYETTCDVDGGRRPFVALRRRFATSWGGIDDGGPRELYGVTCAGSHGYLHLVGQGSDGQLYHALRMPGGVWQDRFSMIRADRLGGPEMFTTAACACDGDVLHLIVLDADGQLCHTMRDTDGAWHDFQRLGRGQLHDTPTRFVAIDCAAVGNCLQIVGAASDGLLYHTVRWPDGTWQRYFGVLGGQQYGGAPRFALSVGCARVHHGLEVIAVGADNQLFHATRRPDGSWRESLRFGLADGDDQFINRVGHRLDDQPAFYDVSCASAGDALHIVGSTWQGGFA
jgi:hypothetical protein